MQEEQTHMATYQGLLHDWKTMSATRPINQLAYTPAGVLSMMTPDANAATGVIDLAPLETLSAATREHERRRLVEDARMIGLHITATAMDERGAYHYRVRIERGPNA